MVTEFTASDARALAPRWHTALLVALILAVAITGTLLEQHAAPVAAQSPVESRIVRQYLPLLLVNWGLTAYVCRLFLTHSTLPALLGRRWNEGGLLLDLLLAFVLGMLIVALESLALHGNGAGRNAATWALLPSTEAERLTWLLVALSVGFCEEVVYRGYLQTQLGAFSGHPAIGVVAQAVLFGLAHLEQGVASALRVTGYGLVFGALAQFRRSLLPGIVCHVGIDLASAFLR